MYKTWVIDINLSDDASGQDVLDPDYPNAGELTKHSTKHARTGVAMIKMVQSRDVCIREFWANYLNDSTPTSMSPSNINVFFTYILN